MDQIYIDGHSIVFKGNNLIIDGKLVDVKLKRSLFGGTIVNSFVSNEISKIKIGRNTIVLKDNKITINGKEINFEGEKPVESKSLEEEPNNNARKYSISTIKEDKKANDINVIIEENNTQIQKSKDNSMEQL